MGVSHRGAYLESILDYIQKKKGVWFTTGEEIYEWYSNGQRAAGGDNSIRGWRLTGTMMECVRPLR